SLISSQDAIVQRRPTLPAPPYQVVGIADSESLAGLVVRRSRCPATPRIPYLALPGEPSPVLPPIPSVFPIDLSLLGMSPVQWTSFSDLIPACTMVSVRDTSGYVLCNISTGRSAMTSGDFVAFLQHFVRAPLPSYAVLSEGAQVFVGETFLSRHGYRNKWDKWDRFVRGDKHLAGGPTGWDLLGGNISLTFFRVGVPRPRYPW
ncbi:hypothetical protein B0H14DRAFT_2874617, partial [Mycena olivaceomarginata]